MKDLIKKNEEIIRYLIVGGLTTLVSLASYYLLTISLLNPKVGFELQVANIISWILSVTFAYFTNRKFVFKADGKMTVAEAFKFYLSRVSTLLIDMALMFVFVSCLNFSDKIIKIIVQFIVIVLNYIFSKVIVFKKGDSK